MDRRSSMASSRRLRDPRRSRASVRFSNPDVFSDDFASEPVEPAENEPLSPDQDRVYDVSPTRPFEPATRVSEDQRSLENTAIVPTADDAIPQSSPASQHQRRPSSFRRTFSSSSSSNHYAPHRSLSISSNITMPRAQSPYQGATGPSHPYGMYPQGIGMTRTPSNATNSTVRNPHRSYNGPSGPTQPYGMYLQNTMPDDRGLAPPSQSIPVGFLGLAHGLQRRYDPEENDVGDIIGPDGYTEHLPPYSRYAPELSPKAGSNNPAGTHPPCFVSAAPNDLYRLEDSQATLETIRTDDSIDRVPHSNDTRRDDSSTTLAPSSSEQANSANQGGHMKERVKRKSRKRICCDTIPIWLAALIIAIVIAIMLGGVIGGILGHKKGKAEGQQQNQQQPATDNSYQPQPLPSASTVIATVTTTSLIDAIPLTASATNLPSIPTGYFTIPLGMPTNSSHQCLSSQPSQLQAWTCSNETEIEMQILDGNPQQVTLSSTGSENPPFRYGAATPAFNGPVNLMVMNDKSAADRGPAYFFQQEFTKLVIVPENEISAGSEIGSGKRWLKGDLERRDTTDSANYTKIADKPWYCYWNTTIIEGFIYAQDGSYSAPPLPSYPARRLRKRDEDLDKPIKLEERRRPNSPRPFCQQMQIMNDGYPQPWSPSGEPVIVNLTTTQELMNNMPNQHGPMNPPRRRRDILGLEAQDLEKRYNQNPTCLCIWDNAA